jgi:non-ribosomal peptide synthetase component E (peptide arylation enzyme)
MVPDRVCVLPELPHNANGKVDVVVLAQRMAPCTDNT